MTLTLYRLEGCPHCERVVDALEAFDCPFESVWVEARHSERDEVKRVSGQRSVPVLVDDDNEVVMAESDRIVAYLKQTHAPVAQARSD